MTKKKAGKVTRFTCRMDRAMYWVQQGGRIRMVGPGDQWFGFNRRTGDVVDDFGGVVVFTARDFNKLWEVML